jgi:hypothetical protein
MDKCFSTCDKTYDKLKLVIDVVELININYISGIDPEDLVVSTIKGVLTLLSLFRSIWKKNI